MCHSEDTRFDLGHRRYYSVGVFSVISGEDGKSSALHDIRNWNDGPKTSVKIMQKLINFKDSDYCIVAYLLKARIVKPTETAAARERSITIA
jgi:hypothetical protein